MKNGAVALTLLCSSMAHATMFTPRNCGSFAIFHQWWTFNPRICTTTNGTPSISFELDASNGSGSDNIDSLLPGMTVAIYCPGTTTDADNNRWFCGESSMVSTGAAAEVQQGLYGPFTRPGERTSREAQHQNYWTVRDGSNVADIFGDAVFELVFDPTTTNGIMIDKFDHASGNLGYRIESDSNGTDVQLYISDGVHEISARQDAKPGGWEYVYAYYKFNAVNGMGVCINGVCGVPANTTSITTANLSNSGVFSAGSDTSSEAGYSYINVQYCNACLVLGDQATTAKARFQQLVGLLPSTHLGSSVMTFTRAGFSDMEGYDNDNAIRWTVPLSDGWPRVSQALNSPVGYQSETIATNLLIQSQAFNVSWVPNASTIGINLYLGLDQTMTADGVAPTNANVVHGVTSPATALAAVPNTFSAWAQLAATSIAKYVYLRDVTDTKSAWFDLNDCSAGTASAGVTPHVEDWGDQNGDSAKWCRIAMTWTPSAGNHTLRLAGSIVDNATTYVGAGVDDFILFGAQDETGTMPSSYMATAASIFNRAADVLNFPVAGNYTATNPHEISTTFAGQAYTLANNGSLCGFGTPTNFEDIRVLASNNNGATRGVVSSVAQWNIDSTNQAVSTTMDGHTWLLHAKTTEQLFSLDAVQVGSAAGASISPAGGVIAVGYTAGLTTGQPNGIISDCMLKAVP